MATIEIIIGSMFSGKSTELLRRCKTYMAIDKNVLIINHKYDTRCLDVLQTHDDSTINATKLEYLKDIQFTNDIDVIAIDESQFFTDLIEFIKEYETKNIIILIAGLDGDANRNKFGNIIDIIPYANSVTKLNAMCSICKDGTPASFSKRYVNSKEIICVGATDKYQAVCRKHFILSNDDSNLNM